MHALGVSNIKSEGHILHTAWAQEKAQSLKPSELEAFLLNALRDSPSFSSASGAELQSAVGYLKQASAQKEAVQIAVYNQLVIQMERIENGAPI